jgi:hypothetical protein
MSAYLETINSLRFKRDASAHRDGIALITSGWAFWRGIATPGYIRDQVNQLMADTMALDSAVINEVESRGEIGNKTSPFWIFSQSTMLPLKIAVSNFFEDHQSWASNLWGSVLDTVNSYREKLVDVHRAAIALGFTLSGAPVPKGRSDFGDPTLGEMGSGVTGIAKSGITAVWGVVKTILYVTLFVGMGIALVYVVKSLRS